MSEKELVSVDSLLPGFGRSTVQSSVRRNPGDQPLGRRSRPDFTKIAPAFRQECSIRQPITIG
jgi:hypothetical protein